MSISEGIQATAFMALAFVAILLDADSALVMGCVICSIVIVRTARPRGQSFVVTKVEGPTITLVPFSPQKRTQEPDPDRCLVDPYYTSGPVTPMSREEAEEDRRVMSHRCARGTAGCFVDHVKGER